MDQEDSREGPGTEFLFEFTDEETKAQRRGALPLFSGVCLELAPEVAASPPSALATALTLKNPSQLERPAVLYEQGRENTRLALIKWAVRKLHDRRNQEGGREMGLDGREE